MDKRRTRSRNMRKKKEKKFNWNIIIKISAVLGFIFIATFFSLLNMGSKNIINNVYIDGISVSSLSSESARNKLEPILEEKLSKEIAVKYGEYETTILPAEINFSYDLSSSLEKAYAVGRTGNIITNNLKILSALFMKTNIDLPISYNTDKLNKIIENMSVEIPDLVVEPSYYISNDELILTKGSEGNQLNKEKTKEFIISAIENSSSEISLPVSKVQPEAIDMNKIHEDIYCEPQNASVSRDPDTISVEKKGVDFAISVEEASN